MSAHGPAPSTFAPVSFLASGAFRLGEALGNPLPRLDYQRVRLDPTLGRQIADAYMAAPSQDERALHAYHALRRETEAQFDFLTRDTAQGGLGVCVQVVEYDPYPDAWRMVEDLKQRRLKVYSSSASGNPHPFLTDRENDMLRAVHDAFGHGTSGRGFDPDGEEAAWLAHRPLYSPPARPALATETRGQSCSHLFHYGGRRFPEQKLTLLPIAAAQPRLGAARKGGALYHRPVKWSR